MKGTETMTVARQTTQVRQSEPQPVNLETFTKSLALDIESAGYYYGLADLIGNRRAMELQQVRANALIQLGRRLGMESSGMWRVWDDGREIGTSEEERVYTANYYDDAKNNVGQMEILASRTDRW